MEPVPILHGRGANALNNVGKHYLRSILAKYFPAVEKTIDDAWVCPLIDIHSFNALNTFEH